MQLLTFLLIPLFGWSSDHNQVDSLHQQAYRLLDTDLDSAIVIANQSIPITQEEGYDWGEANAYYIIGYAYRQKNDLSKAFYMYLKAAAILEGLNDEKSAKMYTSILLNSGGILRNFYQYEGALQFYDKGLKLAKLWGLPKQEQKLLYNKASTSHDMGNLNLAGEMLQKAAQLANQHDDHIRLIRCWNLFGLINKDGGFYNSAREYYQHILDSLPATNRDHALAYHNMAITYQEENHLDIAVKYFEKALALEGGFNDDRIVFSTLHDLAGLYFDQGDLVQAENYAIQGENLVQNLLLHPESYKILYLLNLIYLEKENLEKSKHYTRQLHEKNQAFHDLQESIIQQLKSFQMELILAGFEVEQKAKAQKAADRQVILTQAVVIAICLILFAIIYIKRKLLKRALEKMLEKLKWVD